MVQSRAWQICMFYLYNPQLFLSHFELLENIHTLPRLLNFSSVCSSFDRKYLNSALLRHGISIWIDVPLEIAAKGDAPFSSEPSPEVFLLSFSLTCSKFLSVLLQRSCVSWWKQLYDALKASYEKSRKGYDTADAVISLESKDFIHKSINITLTVSFLWVMLLFVLWTRNSYKAGVRRLGHINFWRACFGGKSWTL